jgi:hypothetical protein
VFEPAMPIGVGLWLLFLPLVGCGKDSDPIAQPPPLPVFTAQKSGAPTSGQVLLHGQGLSQDVVRLSVEQNVVSKPEAMQFLLRVDPGAGAAIRSGSADGCGVGLQVTPTGNAGEWRLHGSGTFTSCTTCADPSGPLVTVDLFVGNAGSWPISLAHAAVTGYYQGDVFGCTDGWQDAAEMLGGTVTNP